MYVPSSETRAAALIHQLVPRLTGQCALLLLFISETLIRLDHPNLKPNFLTLYDSILESPCSFFIVAVIDSCHGHLLFALLISICVFFLSTDILFTFHWVLEVFHLLGHSTDSTLQLILMSYVLCGTLFGLLFICQRCVALGFNWASSTEERKRPQLRRFHVWADF